MNWHYYNHAMLPNGPPHETIDLTPILDKSIWERTPEGSQPLFARWVSDFDCGYETNWWYCIKDGVYDISKLKAKRRYEITKARKNFDVAIINTADYAEELYTVKIASMEGYAKGRIQQENHDAFVRYCKQTEQDYFAAFLLGEDGKRTNQICGYLHVPVQGICVHLSSLKTDPLYEKLGVNAALIDGVLTCYADELQKGTKYICDGQRNILHETAFQDYLEKYFGFRKAYCKLNILYHPSIKWAIPIVYLFRNALKKLDRINLIHAVNGITKMEEYIRKDRKSQSGGKV